MKYLIHSIADVIEQSFINIELPLERGGIGIDENTGIHVTCSFEHYHLSDWEVKDVNELIEDLHLKGIPVEYEMTLNTKEEIFKNERKVINMMTYHFKLWCELKKVDHSKDLIKSLKTVDKFNL